MPIIPPGYGQVNFKIRLTGDQQDMMTTMGFAFDEIVVADLQGIIDDLSETFLPYWVAGIGSAYSYVGCDAYINFGGDRLVFSSVAGAGPGTGGANSVPQNCAYLVKKITAAGGRTGRGRMYVPGVPDAVVENNGAISSATLSGMNGSLPTWLSNMNGVTGIDQCVLLHSLVGDVPNDIIGLQLDPFIATQRRRLR